MSYAKSLKKSPFKTISLTLGKMPDGSIWQSAFITQDGDLPSASFDCPSNATAAERKGFLPLVKEALKRAQSLDELTDLLKPSAVDRPAPDIRAGVQWSEEDKALMQQNSVKVQLLYLLAKHEDPADGVEAVLNSGLLPEALLRQWLNQLVERAIRRVLEHTGIGLWELWAVRWLEATDRSEDAAQEAADIAAQSALSKMSLCARAASWAALDVARGATRDAIKSARYVAFRCPPDGETGIDAKKATGEREIKVQYDDLFSLINTL